MNVLITPGNRWRVDSYVSRGYLFTISRVEENSGRVPLSPPIHRSIVRQHVLYAHNLRNGINQTQLGVETYSSFITSLFYTQRTQVSPQGDLVSPVVLLVLTPRSTPTVATQRRTDLQQRRFMFFPLRLQKKITLAETLCLADTAGYSRFEVTML
jgi:hypothetical protein